MRNNQNRVAKCGIPIIQKTIFVLMDIVDGVSVPLMETENHLVALAKLIELKKENPFIHQFKIIIKS